jgi:hypothetical protein
MILSSVGFSLRGFDLASTKTRRLKRALLALPENMAFLFNDYEEVSRVRRERFLTRVLILLWIHP